MTNIITYQKIPAGCFLFSSINLSQLLAMMLFEQLYVEPHLRFYVRSQDSSFCSPKHQQCDTCFMVMNSEIAKSPKKLQLGILDKILRKNKKAILDLRMSLKKVGLVLPPLQTISILLKLQLPKSTKDSK